MTSSGTLARDARHWLCVFWIDEAILDDVVDIGEDPDFSSPAPTWGICRPNIRASLRRGDTVTFVGYARTKRQYLYKGSFKVSESLTYVEALSRYPSRRNVIIRESWEAPNGASEWVSKSYLDPRTATHVDGPWLPDFRGGRSASRTRQGPHSAAGHGGRVLESPGGPPSNRDRPV